MSRWKCICAYDGTAYYGWQSQVEGNTVQDILETKLKSVFKTAIRIHGAGRTDSGVHANGQVFHFDAVWKHGVEKLALAINSGLPEDIQVLDVASVDDKFHSRFLAKKKRYVYHFHSGKAIPRDIRYYWSINKKLDIKKMQKAANHLVGKHDFTSFAASRGDGSKEDPVKTIYKISIMGKSEKIQLMTEGSGYLYKMVRSMVGVLVEVGLGRINPSEVKLILKEKKRTKKVPTAPARGLFLDKVFY